MFQTIYKWNGVIIANYRYAKWRIDDFEFLILSFKSRVLTYTANPFRQVPNESGIMSNLQMLRQAQHDIETTNNFVKVLKLGCHPELVEGSVDILCRSYFYSFC